MELPSFVLPADPSVSTPPPDSLPPVPPPPPAADEPPPALTLASGPVGWPAAPPVSLGVPPSGRRVPSPLDRESRSDAVHPKHHAPMNKAQSLVTRIAT